MFEAGCVSAGARFRAVDRRVLKRSVELPGRRADDLVDSKTQALNYLREAPVPTFILYEETMLRQCGRRGEATRAALAP